MSCVPDSKKSAWPEMRLPLGVRKALEYALAEVTQEAGAGAAGLKAGRRAVRAEGAARTAGEARVTQAGLSSSLDSACPKTGPDPELGQAGERNERLRRKGEEGKSKKMWRRRWRWGGLFV